MYLFQLSIRYRPSFSRIIAADCLWVSDRHVDLVRSMCSLLDYDTKSRVLVVAGLHTGRNVLSQFFRIAEEMGLYPDEDGIVENNLIDGKICKWRDYEVEEDTVERKKWLVIAKLKRHASLPSSRSAI